MEVAVYAYHHLYRKEIKMEVFIIIFFLFVFAGLSKNKSVPQGYKNTYRRNHASHSNHVVYVIYSTVNRKLYIGMTSNYNKRKQQHFDYDYRQKQNKVLYQHMDAIGATKFNITPIITGLTYNEAMYAESKLIKNWGTLYPYGYNVNPEIQSRQLGYNVAKYNNELYNRLQTISTQEYKNKLLWGE
jgi:predicted GIY-YIG superfamily endonuclease